MGFEAIHGHSSRRTSSCLLLRQGPPNRRGGRTRAVPGPAQPCVPPGSRCFLLAVACHHLEASLLDLLCSEKQVSTPSTLLSAMLGLGRRCSWAGLLQARTVLGVASQGASLSAHLTALTYPCSCDKSGEPQWASCNAMASALR